jgi:hypothetical protein
MSTCDAAVNMVIERDQPITMDDGLVLRADVYRPKTDAPVPVIMTLGPYGKGVMYQDHYKAMWDWLIAQHPDLLPGSSRSFMAWETVDPETWVPWGYAVVRVDSRGACRSPGMLDIFSPRETLDYYHAIEWAGTRPWSNGKVGLNGISYYAINQWHVAQLQPPHHTAMIPWEGAADMYRFQGTIDPHTPLAQGWLRASHRKLDKVRSLPYRPYHVHDDKRPLTPGQVYELDLEVWPMCIVLPAGFRIAVNIAGRDFERPGSDDPKLPFPARGSGPWMHNDRYDRPTDIFAGTPTAATSRCMQWSGSIRKTRCISSICGAVKPRPISGSRPGAISSANGNHCFGPRSADRSSRGLVPRAPAASSGRPCRRCGSCVGLANARRRHHEQLVEGAYYKPAHRAAIPSGSILLCCTTQPRDAFCPNANA